MTTDSVITPDIERCEKNSHKQEIFEKCLDEVGFGKFQAFAILVAFVGNTAFYTAVGNTPYILPNAECDLGMNLVMKGLLTAISFGGSLTSGFFAGLMSDAFGRKRFLVVCFACTSFFVMVEGTAQNYYTLLVAKFAEGIVLNGALSANIAYMSEVVHRKIRDRIMLLISSFLITAQIIVALMAWAILPQNWLFEVGNGFIVLHSWNMYFYACGLWSIAASFMYCLLPESPKFLFSHGRYEEALEVLKKMYTMNTGKTADSFQYKTVCDEVTDSRASSIDDDPVPALWQQKIVEGLKDAKALFQRPLLCTFLQTCCMLFMLMLGFNTMRMWYPQLSTIIESYTEMHNTTDELCIMLDTYMANQSSKLDDIDSGHECVPIRSGSETYINSVIMASASLIPYFISGIAVVLVGKKPLIFVAVTISCTSCMALYWSSSPWEVMILVTAVTSISQCCVSLILTIVVEVFPTSLKTFTISLLISSGRIGTLLGNVMFPLMLERGCMVPFFTIGSMLASVGLLTIFLPASKK